MGAELFRKFWSDVVAIPYGDQAQAAVDQDTNADAADATLQARAAAPTNAAAATSAEQENPLTEQTQPELDVWRPPTPRSVTIVVSPRSLIVDGKGWQQFTATGYLDDGSERDLTSSVRWSTSDPGVARLGGPGRVFFTGKPGGVMINVHDKQTGQLCGAAVYVRGSSPAQPQPPVQPDNGDPVYAQGDGSVSDAVSTAEGTVQDTSGGGNESTDGLSASAGSGEDVSAAASDTTPSDGLSGSDTGASD